MKPLFINHYPYDKKTAREAMTVFWHHKSRRSYVILGCMVAFFCILSPVFESALFLIPAIIGLFGYISLWIQQSGSIRKELENVKRTFHSDAPFLRIEIYEDEIRTTVSNTKNKAPVSAVEGYRETKNMFVLFLKGQMTLALKKDSFEKGNSDSFRAWADGICGRGGEKK